MKNYKLAHEAKDHFVIHDVNDGKSFKLAKKALSEKSYQQVKQLPRFAAEGGEVAPSEAPVTVASSGRMEALNQLNPLSGISQYFYDDTKFDPAKASSDAQSASGLGNSTPVERTPVIPAATSTSTPASSDSTPLTAGSPALPVGQEAITPQSLASQLFPGNPDIVAAAKKDADSQTALAGAKSDAYAGLNDALKDRDVEYKERHQQLVDEGNGLYQDIITKKVDPNQYWNAKSTGNKIGTAIAIALGGLGGGISGRGGNAALDVVNKAIDNDILSQRENLANKRSLLSLNLERTRSLEAAEQLTRAQMLTAVQAKLDQAGAKAQGETAQNRYQALKGELANNQAMVYQQLAGQLQQRTSNNRLLTGSGTLSDVANAAPETRELLVKNPADETYAMASSKDDAKELRTKSASLANVVSQVKRLDGLGPAAAVPGTPQYREANSIAANLRTQIGGEEALKRYSPEVIKMLNDQIGNPTGFAALVGQNGQANRGALIKSLRDDFNNQRAAKTYQAQPYVPPSAKPGFK